MPHHSESVDFHDSLHDSQRLDALILAALDESMPEEVIHHVDDCDQCLSELAGLRQVVWAGRAGLPEVDPAATVPAHVWDAIATELGLASSAAPVLKLAPRRRARTGVLAAAAAVVALAAGVGGYLLGHHSTTPTPVAQCAEKQARLMQMGEAAGASGSAVVSCSDHGPALAVTTANLPPADGYYEVWLYAPTTGNMIAIGNIGSGGGGSFTLPNGVNLADYHVVDVSAQRYDGNPAHGTSVLRGPLTS